MDRLRYAIGIATLVVTAVVGWYLFGLLSGDDTAGMFRVQIEFRDVRGLKAGADVRYRGVHVGTVRAVALTPDGEKARVTALLEPSVENLARQSSRFWIVVPRFGGLTDGATGLDTLVRDAYVAFLTPLPAGPPLAPDSLMSGLEKPFRPSNSSADLDPVRRGDLLMTLLANETQGLDPGSPVRFRGVEVGDVRSIALAEDGSFVAVQLRIRQRYRRTVTERSEFWIARPRLSGALLRGIAVEDLTALLSPFVGYQTPEEAGVPVPDGYRAVASVDRPELHEPVTEKALSSLPPPDEDQSATEGGDVRLVEVIYEVEERDWLSPNDHDERRGTGLLFLGRDGRPAVLTARSLCDGAYYMTDTFGSPDIASEAVRVAIPGGTVLRAGRTWVAADGKDLAMLVLEDAPPDLPVTPAGKIAFDDAVDPKNATVRAYGGGEGTALGDVSALGLAKLRGALVSVGDEGVGVVGQPSGHDEQATVVPLGLLPPELRPEK